MTDKINMLACADNTIVNNKSKCFSQLQSSEPLWKRVPTRDNEGKPYVDFMMLIPGLRKLKTADLHQIINKIKTVLMRYEDDIILADLNLKLNVLWVTIKPHPGLSIEIAALLHHLIPEAKLVSQHSATGSNF